jgi:hypothetical protein
MNQKCLILKELQLLLLIHLSPRKTMIIAMMMMMMTLKTIIFT